jgi:hypothetical protein
MKTAASFISGCDSFFFVTEQTKEEENSLFSRETSSVKT